MASGDLITRIYSNFRGVDFRGEDVNILRSPDSLNMWKDYKEVDSIRTRPEFEKVDCGTGVVWGFHPYTDDMGIKRAILHMEDKVYGLFGKQNEGEWLPGEYFVIGGAPLDVVFNQQPSQSFIYNKKIYIKDGEKYFCADVDGITCKEVVGYIPTTSIGRKPSGGGTIHEDVNMLSDYRINTFCTQDEATNEFYLDAQFIDDDFKPIVEIKNFYYEDWFEYAAAYEVDYEKGLITTAGSIAHKLTDGQDNVRIKYKKSVSGVREKIEKCTMLEVFDNRVFFSGNPEYPNMIWHSSLENPEYVSDLDYYEEGLDTTKITGMVAGNNALWVMKEPSSANTTIFYHTPTIDAEYGKIYPNTHSNISIGCVGRAINFSDDIVFFSERGMEGIHGDITTEQVLGHRSTLVDKKFLNEENYKNMVVAEWEGYLFVFIDNKVYLADSRGTFTNENHMEYEWFYWEIEHNVTCATVDNGILYIGTTDGLYKLTDNISDVVSYWTTPKDKFKYPHYMKTTNKRGCVAEGTGNYSVYVKTNKTNGFEWINNYYNVSDYTVSRIKRKKFKDIQLKFASDTRFSLESVTLECFIGGYIKR